MNYLAQTEIYAGVSAKIIAGNVSKLDEQIASPNSFDLKKYGHDADSIDKALDFVLGSSAKLSNEIDSSEKEEIKQLDEVLEALDPDDMSESEE